MRKDLENLATELTEIGRPQAFWHGRVLQILEAHPDDYQYQLGDLRDALGAPVDTPHNKVIEVLDRERRRMQEERDTIKRDREALDKDRGENVIKLDDHRHMLALAIDGERVNIQRALRDAGHEDAANMLNPPAHENTNPIAPIDAPGE